MTTIRPALMLVLSLLTAHVGSQPLVLEPLDELLPDSAFADSYATRQWSIATDINDQGYVLGFQLTAEAQFRTYNIALQTNPAATVIDTPDFIGLSAGPQFCIWIICTGDLAFGIQIGESTAGTNFVGGAADTNLVPGTLPLSFFPGDFVEENSAGVVISTQRGESGQYGVIFDGESLTPLIDIPWLVDINNNSPAQVLAYDGTDGDCLVTGIGCPDDEDDSEHCEEDRHRHQNGVGHHSHGRGFGYGHHCDGPAHAHSARSSGAGGGALMLSLTVDAPAQRLRFPDKTDAGEDVSNLFPLAISNNRAVLRGTVTEGNNIWSNRLLSCQFNAAALDENGDDVIDCLGGLMPVETLAMGTDIGTVLGFSLAADGTLIGNLGFTPSGIGIPAIWALSTLPTSPDLLINRLGNHGDHELSVITAGNNNGQGVGYGFPNCGDTPDAYRFSPVEGELSTLGFSINDIYTGAWAAPGQNYSVAPAATGGSGQYLYRYSIRRPGEESWTLAQDWADSALAQTAGAEEEEICYRIELADANNMADQRQQVLRFRIADAEASDGGSPRLLPANPSSGLDEALEEALPIGSASAWFMLALLLGQRRRRTPQAA